MSLHAIFKPRDLREVSKVDVSPWNSYWWQPRPSKSSNLKPCFSLTLYDRMHTDCGIIYVLKGIVALLFRALQEHGPAVWKAQLLAFRERCVPSPWQCRSLPSPLLLLSTSYKEFKQRRQPGLSLRPSTPLCHPVRSSWLTFNSKAAVKKRPRSMKCVWSQGCTLATPYLTPPSLWDAGVPWACSSIQRERWAGIKAQSPGVSGPMLWCSDTDVESISYYHCSGAPQLPVLPLHFKRTKYQRLPFFWLCTAGLECLMCTLVYISVILNYSCPVFLWLITFL